MSNTDLISEDVNTETLQFVSNAIKSDSFKLMSLAGDASHRRYYRVIHDRSSSVLMAWEPFTSVEDYPFLSVQKLLKAHGVNVPEVLATSKELGLLLLEDLGDLTLERKFWEQQNQENILPFYKMALDQLLKIHFSATKDATRTSVCFNIEFDEAKFLWELNFTKKHLIEGLCGVELSATEAKALEESFLEVSRHLDEQPKRISHRDFHSRNLMLNLDKMTVIDFQDARMGPVQYDLVSLLCDSYVALEPAFQNKLIAYYLEKAQTEYGEFFNFEDFMKTYHIQLVQRCFKACGSFASFYNLRSDERYLSYIQPTLARLYDVLKTFNLSPALTDLIERHKILDFDYEANL